MLNKSEFVNYIAENYDTTKKYASEVIELFTDAFKKATIECGGVGIVGFGSSKITDKKERTYVTPLTKSEVTVPAHQEIKFDISDKFKNALTEN